MDIVEAALRVVARLGIVELDALHPVLAETLPHREHVVGHALVRQVVRHVGAVVHVLAFDAVRGVEEHPVPVRDREVVAGHSHLDVGVGDAVPRLDRGTPLGERLVGRAEVSVLRPVRVVVPTLLRVAVVMVAVVVWLEAHAHLGILRETLFIRHVEFLHERGGVVDVAEPAERAHGPAAEERKVVDVRVRAVRLAHGASVRLGGGEGVVRHRVDVERIGGEELVRAGLHEHAHLVCGVERERTVIQLGHLAVGVVLETARDKRTAPAVHEARHEDAVRAVAREAGNEVRGLRARRAVDGYGIFNGQVARGRAVAPRPPSAEPLSAAHDRRAHQAAAVPHRRVDTERGDERGRVVVECVGVDRLPRALAVRMLVAGVVEAPARTGRVVAHGKGDPRAVSEGVVHLVRRRRERRAALHACRAHTGVGEPNAPFRVANRERPARHVERHGGASVGKHHAPGIILYGGLSRPCMHSRQDHAHQRKEITCGSHLDFSLLLETSRDSVLGHVKYTKEAAPRHLQRRFTGLTHRRESV